MEGPISVLKFGSSVLTDERAAARVVHEVYNAWRDGHRVIAVVSALAGETDALLAGARALNPNADDTTLAAYVAQGETRSAALVGLYLDRAGVPAHVLDAGAIGLTTTGGALDAAPTGLDVQRILLALSQRPVLVVPGFLGRDELGSTTLLGRGGSDLTALYIAARLRHAPNTPHSVRCVLIKDVDGLYDRDPALYPHSARRYVHASHDDVLALPEGIVQHKAVRASREYRVEFGVGTVGHPAPTRVGPGPSALAQSAAGHSPVRVALAGCGVVGRGVHDLLRGLPDLFDLVGVAVRDVAAHRDAGVDRSLLVDSPAHLLGRKPAILVETIGGLGVAADLVRAALDNGVHVVSANKSLLADRLPEFETLCQRTQARLCFSAAVGGGVPMLETVRRCASRGRITHITGVLNGTTSFVLDELARGVSFAQAVSLAQRAGFAESDPRADLSGADAAAKARLIAHAATGSWITTAQIRCTGIDAVTADEVTRAMAGGGLLRLVAHISLHARGPQIVIEPRALDATSPLSRLRGEQNGLIIELENSSEPVFVCGRGAGRWPTAQSVLADLFSLLNSNRSDPAAPPQSGDRNTHTTPALEEVAA